MGLIRSRDIRPRSVRRWQAFRKSKIAGGLHYQTPRNQLEVQISDGKTPREAESVEQSSWLRLQIIRHNRLLGEAVIGDQ